MLPGFEEVAVSSRATSPLIFLLGDMRSWVCFQKLVSKLTFQWVKRIQMCLPRTPSSSFFFLLLHFLIPSLPFLIPPSLFAILFHSALSQSFLHWCAGKPLGSLNLHWSVWFLFYTSGMGCERSLWSSWFTQGSPRALTWKTQTGGARSVSPMPHLSLLGQSWVFWTRRGEGRRVSQVGIRAQDRHLSSSLNFSFTLKQFKVYRITEKIAQSSIYLLHTQFPVFTSLSRRAFTFLLLLIILNCYMLWR